MIFAIFRSHFGVGSGMMDDTAYIIIPSMRILGVGDGNVLVNYPESSLRNQSMVFPTLPCPAQ